jgi:uncharacterized protein
MRKLGSVAAIFVAFLLCACTLHYYSKTGNVQGIQDALAGGAKVDQPNDRGETPLMVAAFSGQAQVIDHLCRNGADINARSPYGATALIYAAYYGQLDSTKALLKYNPDKTIKDKFNNTALDYAVYYNFPAIAALLKEP